MSEEKNINSHSLKCKENVWKKFVSLIDEMDNVNTQGQALERLIDVYEEPPKTKILDKEIASQNEDLIKKNQELQDKIDYYFRKIMSSKFVKFIINLRDKFSQPRKK